ncbi:methyl-accepting chemotaxis protein [Clostridium grantii]|uniref:Methyl-accepting chemotaxis sensory transducer with Cache sensor n=1 Tax=Clostridium grantii DSM 8605 TaxID=1121316 RepID=A0A1M5XAR6_9CLOT|nr:methyl-accepting chemotaxis protein [Clostridium grantii]SHH96876.1 methyl-accepting chemotaxis sensory transducer with Cache sensor [Clostridium grantii DSM 8605]
MRSIRGKFIFVIILNVLLVSAIISSATLFILNKNNDERLSQTKEILNENYNDKIKNQVEIIVSQIDGIYDEIDAGIITEDEGKIIAANMIRNAKYGENGYFWVDTLEGTNVVLLGKKDVEGTNRINATDEQGNKYIQNFINIVKESGEGYSEYFFPKAGGDTPLPKRAYVKLYEPFGWIIGTGNYIDDIETFISNEKEVIESQYKNAVFLLFIVLIVSIFIGYMLASFMSKSISNPIKKILDAANTIATGNLNIDLNIKRKDELGSLATAFTIMSDNMNGVLSNINVASEQVASGSKQVADSSISLAQGATEQASSVEQLTASMEQISAQTKFNAGKANEAKEIAENAKENAKQGYTEMKKMLDAMTDINESSNNISKIIKVIDEIAFQTNILALNAAVEAARAGQHGKGFAVVAEEVRNLAARSANAAKETTTMIEGSINKVETGAKIAKNTSESLNKIVDEVAKAANLVGDIASASNEQSIGVSQVNEGILQITDVVQSTSATSEETAAASEELSAQAAMLRKQVSTFKLKKDNYNAIYESSAYESMEELNQDNSKLLDGVDKKQGSSKNRIIHLSDEEFGKY